MNMSPLVEHTVVEMVQWLRLGVEIIGACAIAIGSFIALYRFLIALISKKGTDFIAVRLTLAGYLALALEFQLGADILLTTVAPSWQEIGKLGAIAVIRTALNFFLSREMKDEKSLTGASTRLKGN